MSNASYLKILFSAKLYNDKKKTEHYPFWLITYTTTPENIFDSLLIRLKILILQMSVFFLK